MYTEPPPPSPPRAPTKRKLETEEPATLFCEHSPITLNFLLIHYVQGLNEAVHVVTTKWQCLL
jgi:hypothetical protein